MEPLIKRFQDEVVGGYVELLRSQYRIHPQFDGIRKQWNEWLESPKQLVNGPYLEAASNYALGDPLETLSLNAATKETVNRAMHGRCLYKHQSDALRLLLPPNRKNVVVATGTSSGKTRCFQIPILDDLIRDPSPGLRAIIIYPLNALVNDQLQDWEDLLKEHPSITFARFTGQTPYDQKRYEIQVRKACRARLAGRVDPDLLEDRANSDFQNKIREDEACPNHLRHRAAIRENPPHILITNFSMLEYLLVRPVDAPVFEGANLRFIVLDEAHAYRSVQATEIGFLLRRLKDRLMAESPVCIATSATLGTDSEQDKERVRRFAEGLFGEPFETKGLIYGTKRTPESGQPAVTPSPDDYIAAANELAIETGSALSILPDHAPWESLRDYLERDANVFRLRSELLNSPIRLEEVAKQLFDDQATGPEALSSLLTLIAEADSHEPGREALLPTRLHYFIRAQDGLHVCLRTDCPGRKNDTPPVFPSRKSDDSSVPEGECPHCAGIGNRSKLVELVACRRCGWLYGAVRDLGPIRARANREQGVADPLEPGDDGIRPDYDSFDTNLGWASDNFYTYFSCPADMPHPHPVPDDEENALKENFLFNPDSVEWCAACGKRIKSTTDACNCGSRHVRQIEIFHRQCPNVSMDSLESDRKHLLTQCPNCLSRNTLGLEPVRRFSENEDETGIAAAIPLAHFDVSPWQQKEEWKVRKLLCFADQRQKAAAFPSLLEDEMFPWDFGRKVVRIVNEFDEPLRFTQVADKLVEEYTQAENTRSEKGLLLPVDIKKQGGDDPDWNQFFRAHVFAYFGIPDAARDSVEDFGILRVRYEIGSDKTAVFQNLLRPYGLSEEDGFAFLQTLFGFARKRKAFRLPEGVSQTHPAFGRVTADICLAKEKGGMKSAEGFVSTEKIPKGNENTNYIARALGIAIHEAREVAGKIWDTLVRENILRHEDREKYRLYPSKLLVEKAPKRFQCTTCQTITAWNCRSVCPKKECSGTLVEISLEDAISTLVARWVSDDKSVSYHSLASEEHTAQIAKDAAALIEDDFRNQGVSLLSSTTTFEMGINIGDLQKILLRNAPPNAASYVQRIGRAGRGRDKNAVCVTLCKGTKYDLDCWKEPNERLMCGTVNPPTVFLENAHLAQRHINAFLFATALRNEKEKLGEWAGKQKIPIAFLIPMEERDSIPDSWWPKNTKQCYLDLSSQWETGGSESVTISPYLDPLADAVGGWKVAFQKAREGLIGSECGKIEEIVNDLRSFLKERRERFNEGLPTYEVEDSIKNLLKADIVAVLARRGFLPRYAFPLDVVELVTNTDRYAESEVELSRDRGLAIAEYAPGAQVIARKTLYTSGGLAFSSRREIPDFEWFWRCSTCQLVRTEKGKTKLKDDLGSSCPACGSRVLEASFRRFIQPNAFLHDEKAKASYGRTIPVRQRQGLTHFIDALEGVEFYERGGFQIALKKNGRLFRYNCGPDNKGFYLCRRCGRSEPTPLNSKKGNLPRHKALQFLGGQRDCQGSYSQNVAYGHIFESFCLVTRPLSELPSRESVGYALHRGLCRLLQIDLNEVGVSFRKAIGGKDEIIFYDKAPGGAGLVKEAHERWIEILDYSRQIVESCDCERACYNCLKDFSNQTHHHILNRYDAIAFFSEQ